MGAPLLWDHHSNTWIVWQICWTWSILLKITIAILRDICEQFLWMLQAGLQYKFAYLSTPIALSRGEDYFFYENFFKKVRRKFQIRASLFWNIPSKNWRVWWIWIWNLGIFFFTFEILGRFALVFKFKLKQERLSI